MSKVQETGDTQPGEYSNRPHSYNKFNVRCEQPFNYHKMSNLRIIQKKLLYVIGLSSDLAVKESDLHNFEYFGQYGKITKLIVNKNKIYNTNGPNGPSYSAYITFSSCDECSLAILSIDNTVVDNHLLRASYGTTKYCTNFLKGSECMNKECLYLHYFAEACNILEREDMNVNKSIFLSQQMIAMKEADIFNQEIKLKLMARKFVNNLTILPAPYTIYDKDIIKDQARFVLINKVERTKEKSQDKASLDELCSNSTVAHSSASTNDYYLLRENENCENNFDIKPVVNFNKLYAPKEKSRFNFVKDNSTLSLNNIAMFNSCSSTNSLNTTQDSQVDIPNFVNNLICKKVSRLAYSKNLSKDDEDFIYFDRNLIREYSENNPWALFIINNSKNKNFFPDELKTLIEKDKLQYIRKFNSA